MNSFYEYFAARQKLAAYRQAKRLQRGVKLGYDQNVGSSTATKFTSAALPIGTGDFSIEYFGNSYGSGAYPFLSSVSGTFSCRSAAVGQNGVSSIIVGDSDDPIPVGWTAQSSESRFYLAITRQGTTVKVYINGELKTTKEQSAVKDLGDLQLAIANSSDVGFVRVWNYALSADDVTVHYNNGDPMGYVVPKAMRAGLLAEYLPQNLMESRKGPETEPTADVFEFNIDSSEYQIVVAQQKYPYDCIYRVDYVVDEWDYQPERYNIVGFNGVRGASIIGGDYLWYSLNQAKIGEVQSCLVKMPGIGSPQLWIFGGEVTDATTARHLKVTIKGITPVSVPISWLDSAKQLPLSDEYMEPLFQSIGGYDMEANGAPEIIYDE